MAEYELRFLAGTGEMARRVHFEASNDTKALGIAEWQADGQRYRAVARPQAGARSAAQRRWPGQTKRSPGAG